MNDCPNAEMRDQLCDVVHRTMSDADCQRVEDHVATCADCAAEIALLRKVHAVLTRRAPAVNTSAIVAALPRHRRATRAPSFGTWRVAASVAVIAIGAASFSMMQRGTDGVDSTSAPVVATAADPESFSFAGRLSALDDADLEQLLAEIHEFDGGPAVEPRAILPVPVWDGGTP